MANLRRILIIRLDEIGDMVLTMPMLRAIRSAAPRATITIVAKSPADELLSGCQYVDRTLGVKVRTNKYLRPLVMPVKMATLAVGLLAGEKFDAAILPRWDTDSFYATIFAYFSGASQRVAFAEKSTPRKQLINMGFDKMLTTAVADAEIKHELEHNLAMAQAVGCDVVDAKIELPPGEKDMQVAAGAIGKIDSPLAALAIGAGRAEKRWPAENFIRLGKILTQRGMKIIALGGLSDTQAAADISAQIGDRAINLAGKLTLMQSAAAIAMCKLFVGNDSGPAHISAACGVPTVAVSCHCLRCPPEHEGSPIRFGPRGKKCAVVQPASPTPPCTGPCTANQPHCILAVTVEDVLAAVDNISPPKGVAVANA